MIENDHYVRPFIGLKLNNYGAILADPPWHFKRYSESCASKARAPQDHYDTMSIEEICSLPVGHLTAPDCVLFMWTCWPFLERSFEVIKAWGFEYKTCAFDWMKANVSTIDLFPEPKDADMKCGYWTRSNSEPCLLATKGKPKRLDAGVRMGIIEKSREHSRKPDGVHQRIERLVAGPYCELFARQKRKGWDVWGNQIDKFQEVA